MNIDQTVDRRSNAWIVIVLAVFLVLAIGAAAFFYYESTRNNEEITIIDAEDYTDDVISEEKGESKELIGMPLSVKTEQDNDAHIYTTPIGFPIVSYSDKWTGDKLVAVYDEMLQNTHGEEMTYISRVVIYPGSSNTDSEDFVTAGTHERYIKEYMFFFDIPALLPRSMKYSTQSTLGEITLYNMDDYDSVKQAARTISHEYGHHYTMYYFMQDDDAVRVSDYYGLRDFESYDHDVFFSAQDYLENHNWDIYEIAAEDYAQLLGSPNGRQIIEYIDGYDFLRQSEVDVLGNAAYDTTVNVFPQENIYVPLADDISGLKDYYLSFIGQNSGEEPLEKVTFNITMQRKRSNGYTYYNVTWNKPCEDSKALYTLVCFDMDGYVIWPVRSVNGDEDAIARIGTVSRIRGNYIHWIPDGIIDEDRYFKVYLIWPDGRMQASELFYADF